MPSCPDAQMLEVRKLYSGTKHLPLLNDSVVFDCFVAGLPGFSALALYLEAEEANLLRGALSPCSKCIILPSKIPHQIQSDSTYSTVYEVLLHLIC